MDELAFAIEQGKRILPILYQKCESPFRIRRLQFIDFTGDYGDAFVKLLGALNASTPNGRKKPSPAKPSFLQRIASKRTLIALLIVAALATLGGGLIATWETIFPSGCAARSDYPLGKGDKSSRGDFGRLFHLRRLSHFFFWYLGKRDFHGLDETDPWKGRYARLQHAE